VLTEYRRRKLDLAELIRAAMNFAEGRRDQERVASGRELLARLAEDRFQLAVVGQFSRGKSTLINAFLGRSYLPTGALPMTSVVTTVRYGSRPRATVRRTETAFPIETSIDDIERFVAQASAEREELGVASVDIEVPAEVLRLGFWFVDTPGVGSAIAANTATTRRFLPDADAVIFVTSFDAPLGEPELQFLDEVRRHVERLFFVVNKLDLVSTTEAEDVMRFVRDRVLEHTDGESRMFAISARAALEAKLHGDSERLTSSGLPKLEQTLLRFLTTEKSKSFLLRTCDRADRLLADEKLDVELARMARSDQGRDGARVKRLEDRIADLKEQERAVAAELVEYIRSEFPGALLERSRAWPEELASLLNAAVEQEWPSATGPTARDRVDQARSRLEESGQNLIETWLERRLPEIRSLLVGLAEEHIAKMAALKGSVERAGAEVFGMPFPEPQWEPTEWSSAELPQLAVGRMALAVPLHLPWRFSVMSASRLEDEAHRLLREGLARAAVTAGESARDAVAEAAVRWAEHLGDRMEQEMLDAADRLRKRLGTAGTDQDARALEGIERQLAGFRAEVAAWDVAATASETETLEAVQARAAAPTGALTHCTVCEKLWRVSFQYMAQAQWDLATSRERRAEHVRSGGFCPTHTWQYAEIALDLSVALGYAELAEAAANSLRSGELDASTEQELQGVVAQLLAGRERCPACLALAEAERSMVLEILTDLPAEPHDDGTVPALCVAHTAAVLAANSDLEQGRRLVHALADTLGRASEDMRTYSLKRESFRRRLLTDEETAAYLQAISYLVGNRNLVRPWQTDNDRHLPASLLTTLRRSADEPRA
jgi:GTPase SAR1 family protein/muconolactone delta-isomerase